MTTTTTPLRPGDSFTWLTSGISFLTDANLSGGERVSRRGETVTLTAQLIEANADRTGASLFDLVHDADAQQGRWGREIFTPGAVEVTPWEPGTVEHSMAREDAERIARAEPDDAKRLAARREVERVYGRVENPSGQTSSFTPGDEDRDRYLRNEGLK